MQIRYTHRFLVQSERLSTLMAKERNLESDLNRTRVEIARAKKNLRELSATPERFVDVPASRMFQHVDKKVRSKSKGRRTTSKIDAAGLKEMGNILRELGAQI